MNRCRKKKRMTTGTAASTTPAQKGPHCCAYLSLMNPYRPTGSVNLSVDCSRRLAMMNSLIEKMNESRPTTARTGAASGRMIPQNT